MIFRLIKSSLFLSVCFYLFIVTNNFVFAQERTEINIPNIPGYITLKGDFHIHTVFSDGSVWPPGRVMEAWRDGLDVIALSDHVSLDSKKEDIIINYNRPYELSNPTAKNYNILLIKGAEITRDLPLGHYNAIFLEDVEPLKKNDYLEQFRSADSQKAFIFWNHPGWERAECEWLPVHSDIYNKGFMKGIEVVNTDTYYPKAHEWALDKKLTMLCNSDTHNPIDFEHFGKDNHRPVTLLFVKERTLEGVRNALMNRRTAPYFNNTIIGEERFLSPLFYESVKISGADLFLQKDNSGYFQLHNNSDISYELSANDKSNNYEIPNTITIPANKTVVMNIKKKEGLKSGNNNFSIPFIVNNLWIAPGKGLPIEFKINAFSFNNLRIVRIDKKNENLFRLEIENIPKESQIFYTLDGKNPDLNSSKLSQPFELSGSAHLKLIMLKNNQPIGDIIEKSIVIHKAIEKKIILKYPYHSKYSGGGFLALVNGFKASTDFLDGEWQGYEQVDFDAVIDLEKETEINNIGINFLQDINSWIFHPNEIEISSSDNGKDFVKIKKEAFETPTTSLPKSIISHSYEFKKIKTRFIKIYAKNIGICPSWHQGAGGKAWIFLDEISIY